MEPESDGRERRNRVENDQEERAVEPEERDDEDGVDSSTVQGGRRDTPRAYIYLRGTTAACGLPRLRTRPPASNLTNRQQHTPCPPFCSRNATAPSIDLDALTAGQTHD